MTNTKEIRINGRPGNADFTMTFSADVFAAASVGMFKKIVAIINGSDNKEETSAAVAELLTAEVKELEEMADTSIMCRTYAGTTRKATVKSWLQEIASKLNVLHGVKAAKRYTCRKNQAFITINEDSKTKAQYLKVESGELVTVAATATAPAFKAFMQKVNKYHWKATEETSGLILTTAGNRKELLEKLAAADSNDRMKAARTKRTYQEAAAMIDRIRAGKASPDELEAIKEASKPKSGQMPLEIQTFFNSLQAAAQPETSATEETNTNTTEEEKTMKETTNNAGWTGVQDYAERKAAKIERMQEKAEAARERAAQLQTPINNMHGDIAFFTQPNINTAGGRAFTKQRERMFNQFEKGMEESAKAARYERKAESAAENTAISSDDPEALQKLRAKLESLEALQARMKAANAAIRMKDTTKGDAKLSEMGFDAKQIEELRTPDFCGRVGFPSYALSNNNANIRRIRERIADLEKRAAAPAPQGWKFDGGEVVANVEENRYQVIFDDIPAAEIRDELKRNGFHWSRKNKAWQRMLNSNALYALHRIAALAPIADDAETAQQPEEMPEESAQAETVETAEPAETVDESAQDAAQSETLDNSNDFAPIETALKETPLNIWATTADNSKNEFPTPPTHPEKPTTEETEEAQQETSETAVFIPGMLYTCGTGAIEIVEISGNRVKFTWKRIKPGCRTAKLETDADGNQCFWFGYNRHRVNAASPYKPTAAAQAAAEDAQQETTPAETQAATEAAEKPETVKPLCKCSDCFQNFRRNSDAHKGIASPSSPSGVSARTPGGMQERSQ